MTIARLIAQRSVDHILQCSPGDQVRHAVGLLAERRIGALPVVDGGLDSNGIVAGIFSERDVIYGLAAKGPAFLDGQVGDVMTAPAIAVSPETGVLEALALMTRRRIRHLPVVDDGRLAGFVSIGDLVKYRIDGIEAEAAALRDYIQAG